MSSMRLSEQVKEVKINNGMDPYGRAWSDGRMEINLKRGDVVNTIIHENLHLKDPMMPHGTVYRESDKIEVGMTLPKMAALLLETHDRMLNPIHQRAITRTIASKVVSSIVK